MVFISTSTAKQVCEEKNSGSLKEACYTNFLGAMTDFLSQVLLYPFDRVGINILLMAWPRLYCCFINQDNQSWRSAA